MTPEPNLLANAETAAERIRAGSTEAERTRRLTPDVLDALFAGGLFKAWVPQAVGGAELDVPAALQLYEEVSHADGATGWCVMIGAGAGLFGGFLAEDAAREILGGERDVIAGSGAPTGTARPVPGGFRVSGRWKYTSGANHATWFTANCVIDEPAPAGPRIRAVAVPRSQTEVFDTWDVSGMRATGSHDIAFHDVFVPDDHTFSVFDDEPVAPGPLYRFPFAAIAALSFGPVAVGIARRALDEFAVLAREKMPSGGTERLGETAEAAVRYGEAQSRVAAASVLLHDTAARHWDHVARHGEPDIELPSAELAAAHAVALCASAVDLLYAISGMDVLPLTSALGRCWRDIHAVTQNRAVSALRISEHGGRALVD